MVNPEDIFYIQFEDGEYATLHLNKTPHLEGAAVFNPASFPDEIKHKRLLLEHVYNQKTHLIPIVIV